MRYKGRDVMLMELARATPWPASHEVADPLGAGRLCRSLPQEPRQGKARAILVNAGNANAFTGKAGEASVARCLKATSAALDCKASEVYLASTGVIGEPCPTRRSPIICRR